MANPGTFSRTVHVSCHGIQPDNPNFSFFPTKARKIPNEALLKHVRFGVSCIINKNKGRDLGGQKVGGWVKFRGEKQSSFLLPVFPKTPTEEDMFCWELGYTLLQTFRECKDAV